MIILASQSPRRKEILESILEDIPFTCVPSSFDERSIDDEDCVRLCLKEALAKGKSVAFSYPDDVIISADTMVLYQGEELGKPKDREHALDMLRKLSGDKHEVVTAYCIINKGEVLKERAVKASLYIEKMADAEIEAYIDTGSPFDKAGGYGVQDKDFIESTILKGSMSTIMGLPKEELEQDLIDLEII